MKNFAVFEKRKINNDTQEETAKKLRISKAAYYHKENGNTEFTAKEIKALQSLYGLSLEDFFKYVDIDEYIKQS